MKYLVVLLLFISGASWAQTYPKVTPEQGAGYSGRIRVAIDGFAPPQTNGLPSTDKKFTVPQGYTPFGIDTTGARLWWWDRHADTIAYTSKDGSGSGDNAYTNGYGLQLSGYQFRWDSTVGVPRPGTLITGGSLVWDGSKHVSRLIDLQSTYLAGNAISYNGYNRVFNPDGDSIYDSSTGQLQAYWGTGGIYNRFLSDGTGIVRMATLTNGVLGYTNVPNGGNGRTYYAQSPLIKLNDSTFAIQQASGTQPGYLSNADWTTFNNKQGALNGNGYVYQSGTTTSYRSQIPYADISGAPAPTGGTVTNLTATNGTGQTWTITNPTTTPNISLSLTKDAVGLSNVDNTSDANKPISTATQNALNLKLDKADSAIANRVTANTSAIQANTNKINTKQNKLIPGTNITITNNADSTATISSTAGGGGTITGAGNATNQGITNTGSTSGSNVVITPSFAYQDYPYQSSPPSAPATGFSRNYFNNVGAWTHQTPEGYIKTVGIPVAMSQTVRMPYRLNSTITLSDSVRTDSLIFTRAPTLAEYPHLIDAGAGTESSPYTNADNTAGIQTKVNLLAANQRPGGLIILPNARFNVTSTVNNIVANTAIEGLSSGFNIDPNGLSQGTSGTSIVATNTVFKIGTLTASSRMGNIQFRKLYFYSTATQQAVNTTTGGISAIEIDANLDQPKFENIHIGGGTTTGTTGFDYGILNANTSSLFHDLTYYDKVDILGGRFGVFYQDGTYLYEKWENSTLADMKEACMYVGTGVYTIGWSINNVTFVRGGGNSSVTNPCDVYFGGTYTTFNGCVFNEAGKNLTAGTQTAGAFGLILAGSYNTITGSAFVSNTNGGGIKITGNNNTITACVFQSNQVDIVVSGNNNRLSVPYGTNITNTGSGNIIDYGSPIVGSGKDAVLLNNGNLGIGQTNPNNSITIYNASGANKGITITNAGTGTSDNAAITLANGGGSSVTGTLVSSHPLGLSTYFYSANMSMVWTPDGNYNTFRINPNGRVSVGLLTPTAYLHLRGGTTSAGGAPLKFTAAPGLTTPEAGAFEYDGTHFYGTVGTTRYQIDQQAPQIDNNGVTTYKTASTPADPASGSAVTWFDGTNLKVKKNVGGTVSTAVIY